MGGKDYEGGYFQVDNTVGIVAGDKVSFKEVGGTETFSLVLQVNAGASGKLTTSPLAAAFVTAVNIDLSAIAIFQQSYLDLDIPSNANINDSSGNNIGSLSNLSLQKRSKLGIGGEDFTDFQITTNESNSNLVITLQTSSGKTYKFDANTYNNSGQYLIPSGSKITLLDISDTTNQEKMILEIGSTDLDVATTDKQSCASDAISKALRIGKNVTITTGLSNNDSMDISISDMRNDQLFLIDGAVQSLDISSTDAAIQSSKYVDEAIARVSAERATLSVMLAQLGSKKALLSEAIVNIDASLSSLFGSDVVSAANQLQSAGSETNQAIFAWKVFKNMLDEVAAQAMH
jgi:flagellin-like hook-associated protein FlgL